MVTVNQAQKRGLAAILLLLLLGAAAKANGVPPGGGGGGGAPPAPPPVPPPVPPGPGPGPGPPPPVPPPTQPPNPAEVPPGSTFDPATNTWTDPSGNVWMQTPDGTFSPKLPAEVPPGSVFDFFNNTWTDPSGIVWTQGPDGIFTPSSRLHAFPIGSRINLTIPEGVFPGTVSRHEGFNPDTGEPLYGLDLDIGVNATAIPESLLSPGTPLPPTLPPPTGEFRNLVFNVSADEFFSNEDGRVRMNVSGEHRGPMTSIQARLAAIPPLFQGDEAVSVEAMLPETFDFFAFGPIETGNIGWPAFSFDAGTQFALTARLVETDGMGTVLSVAGSTIAQMDIISQPFCRLENSKGEVEAEDDAGRHQVIRVGETDAVFIGGRNTPFTLFWPVRNLGTRIDSVRLEVRCFISTTGTSCPPLCRFAITDTIIGPSFLVDPGQEIELSMSITLSNFNCNRAQFYDLRMVAADPLCQNIGSAFTFLVVFPEALSAPRMLASPLLGLRGMP